MLYERLFRVLHRLAPDVLTDLQNRSDDPASIAAWAAHWRLDSGVIRHGAALLRHTWTLDPASAPPSRPFDEDRTVRRLVTLDSPEGRWCEAMTRWVDGFANCEALPDSSAENLDEWPHAHGQCMKPERVSVSAGVVAQYGNDMNDATTPSGSTGGLCRSTCSASDRSGWPPATASIDRRSRVRRIEWLQS
jgi:hypothetical protein